MATSARYKTECKATLLDAGEKLLPNESETIRTSVLNLLEEKGVRLEHNCQVCRVDQDTIYMTDGRTVPYRHCIWATGAGTHRLARKLQSTPGQLSCDKYGWFVVTPTLQSTSHPYIFAAGDCATIVDPEHPERPSPPKAGVYAVRSGPILTENLTRYIEHLRRLDNSGDDDEDSTDEERCPPLELQKLTPQDDFLKLLVCGDGCALGLRFGITIQGRWVFDLKDDIDKSFMDLFDVDKLPPPPKVFTGSYDTSQYDQSTEEDSPHLSAAEASELLQRTDDQVDFRVCRGVLRAMGRDEEYRRAVLAEMKCYVSMAR